MKLRTRLAAAALALPILVAAGPAMPDGHMKKPATRLVLLGTQGGPNVRKFRSQPASLIVANGVPYLIDAGEGVVRQLALAGFGPGDMHILLLTHLHFDHVAGLGPLVGLAWSARAKRPIEVYGPRGTSAFAEGVRSYLATPLALYAAIRPAGSQPGPADMLMVHEVDASQDRPMTFYQDDQVTVTAVANTHYASGAIYDPHYGRAVSYAYRFDTADRSIVFTGDTGPSAAVERLARDADVLVSEVLDLDETLIHVRASNPGVAEDLLRPQIEHMAHEHLVPEEVGKLASRARVKLVVLTHVVMGNDRETDFTRYVAGIRKYYAGPVVVGQDMDQF